MNRRELRAEIARVGITNRCLARELGVSEQALYHKRGGRTEFKESEIKKIIALLDLSPRRVNEIFLT